MELTSVPTGEVNVSLNAVLGLKQTVERRGVKRMKERSCGGATPTLSFFGMLAPFLGWSSIRPRHNPRIVLGDQLDKPFSVAFRFDWRFARCPDIAERFILVCGKVMSRDGHKESTGFFRQLFPKRDAAGISAVFPNNGRLGLLQKHKGQGQKGELRIAVCEGHPRVFRMKVDLDTKFTAPLNDFDNTAVIPDAVVRLGGPHVRVNFGVPDSVTETLNQLLAGCKLCNHHNRYKV